MLILNQFDDVRRQNFCDTRLTIGRFQGVHLGHQYLVSHLGNAGGTSPRVVLTFDPPPEDILTGHPHPKIATTEQKISAFRALGIDAIYLIPFSNELAQMPGKEFAQKFIFDLFKPEKIVVGYDFAFGKNRDGNLETLIALKNENAVVLQVSPYKLGDEVVSTSIIRKKIIEGNVLRAKELMGRCYSIVGEVISGSKRGRQLGFPTLNLEYTPNFVLPKEGVYVVKVVVDSDIYLGVCNVGVIPTFHQDRRIKVECHILDFDRDIYSKKVELQFVDRLRDEKKFSGPESLKAAIQNDVNQARLFFLNLPNG